MRVEGPSHGEELNTGEVTEPRPACTVIPLRDGESGLELLLGDTRDVALKLAVADRVLRVLPSGMRYLDVSVPDRPVAGAQSLDSQVEVETSTSTGA